MIPWRTPTVVDLCQAMRAAQDYSALPILADALQDAGYDDPGALEQLRSPQDLWKAEKAVALLMSEETAAAVRWVERFATELGEGGYPGSLPALTYESLMEAAREYAGGENDSPFGDGSMHWSNEVSGREQEFWANYEKVTGTKIDFEIPGDGTAFFACYC